LQYDDINTLAKDLELSGLDSEFVQVTTNARDDIIAMFEVFYGYALGKKINSLSPGKIEIPLENITLRKIK